MHWMLLPLKRYADFSGRSRRKEYWMFTLALVLAVVLTFLLTDLAGDDPSGEPGGVALIVVGLGALAIFIPSLAVQVRRFHDQNRSGWLVLLGFIPYVGSLIVLIFMCLPGTPGPNRFGPNPKDPYGTLSDTDVFA